MMYEYKSKLSFTQSIGHSLTIMQVLQGKQAKKNK
jgi:hypothetical protein